MLTLQESDTQADSSSLNKVNTIINLTDVALVLDTQHTQNVYVNFMVHKVFEEVSCNDALIMGTSFGSLRRRYTLIN